MLSASRSRLSLRVSLLISMSLAVLPLLLSAFLGYHLLNRTVIADYQDVAGRQRNQINPAQDLQLTMLQAEIPLEEYLATGRPEDLRAYRSMLQEIDRGFVQLSAQLRNDADLANLLSRAHEDWRAVENTVTDILALRESEDAKHLNEAISRFDSLQASATARLGTLCQLIESDLERDYQDASLGYERSKWIAGIAGSISLLIMVAGATMFSRTILTSIDKLVEGAEKFAEGDREHTIQVRVPRELHRVAEEFNKMIKVIQKAEASLADQARRDKLTGLLNRRSFEEAVAEAFVRLQRLGERVVLIAADIDHFKKVNDSYGHAAGDQVLGVVAQVMLKSVRSMDKVFRTGGEEFLILLAGADAIAAMETAERIRTSVESRTIRVGEDELRVTVSLGCAELSSPQEGTVEELQKRADIALYRAKESGRNRVVGSGELT